MTTRRSLLMILVLLLLSGALWAQDHDDHDEEEGHENHSHEQHLRHASETGNPAMFNYMINEFFHPRMLEGPRPIWKDTAILAGLDLLLLFELWRRRGRLK